MRIVLVAPCRINGVKQPEGFKADLPTREAAQLLATGFAILEDEAKSHPEQGRGRRTVNREKE